MLQFVTRVMNRRFATYATSNYTTEMKVIESPVGQYDSYRVMDEKGKLIGDEPVVTKSDAIKMYTDMIKLEQMDRILYEAQRQGRISFYMTSFGEEATHIGSATALNNDDMVFGQYREAGVLISRGFTFEQIMNQCYSNVKDLGKGRQMPVHYGSKDLCFQTISSPLGTQIPQAAGAGYALKLEKKGRIAVCYFGEGAASEGDFHAALNMAATLESPVIFFVRNNGYAISTPASEQYKGDGIVSRGIGYGIKSFRVDGNDIWAVHNITKKAREIAAKGEPVLIEAMTYRVGHHSTSDDSTAYRSKEEIETMTNFGPIARMKSFLMKKKWLTEENNSTIISDIKSQVLLTFAQAENEKKPPIREMFTDVYEEIPWNLKEQQEELNRLLEKYPNDFDVGEYSK